MERIISHGICSGLNLNNQAGRGLYMGFPLPVCFSYTWDSLLTRIRKVKAEILEIEKDLEAIKAATENEWLTAPQFAQLSGLNPKTISNYCGAGRLEYVRKDSNGEWLVHRSELKNYKTVFPAVGAIGNLTEQGRILR